LKYLRRSRAGVGLLPSNWSVKMVLPYPVVVQNFLSIDPAELDSCRLRLDDTDRIYFSTMMDDYLEVFGALKCRGRASVFELVGQTGITRTQFCRLFPDDTDRIYLSAMVYDYGEVFATFKGRGRALPASIGLFIMFSSGSKSGFDINFCR
jgi:hypothetical protein